jgi:DNA-binding NarL/FixJ family response regulator
MEGVSEIQQIRVLIVDDHPMIREVIALACGGRAALQVVGYAANGFEALERCAEAVPDVVVLDLGLPGMSGFEVLVHLREQFPSTRVLVVSGRDDQAAVFKSIRLGASGYLGKTGSVEEIAAAVEAVGQGTEVFGVHHQRAVRAELGDLVRRARQGARLAARLTRREREILDLMATGLSSRQMANRLGVSERTVEAHIRGLYRKLDVRTRVQAVRVAAQMNLVSLLGPREVEIAQR